MNSAWTGSCTLTISVMEAARSRRPGGSEEGERAISGQARKPDGGEGCWWLYSCGTGSFTGGEADIQAVRFAPGHEKAGISRRRSPARRTHIPAAARRPGSSPRILAAPDLAGARFKTRTRRKVCADGERGDRTLRYFQGDPSDDWDMRDLALLRSSMQILSTVRTRSASRRGCVLSDDQAGLFCPISLPHQDGNERFGKRA